MSVFKTYPKKAELLEWYKNNAKNEVLEVNAHFHTPYSFSAFENLNQVFDLAQKENIDVLGINDFFTTDGYEEFNDLCVVNKKFPIFSIEFMALQKEEQSQGIRVNDPNNPGRTYFCGKGLNYPTTNGDKQKALLQQVFEESTQQTKDMIEKLNELLVEIGASFKLDFNEIKVKYCKEIVRERHIAKALRIKIWETFSSDDDRKAFFTKVFSGKELASDISNIPSIENEIRGNLLKSGGRAFVEENDKAFLSMEEVVDIIIDAGGVPCYPTLADDANGNYTDYEGDFEMLYQKLTAKNVFALELIPGRNKFEPLKKFVQFFNEKDFVITFGTEHNTPALDPLTVTCSGGVKLDEELKRIAYEGVCVLAANQYLNAQGEEGYVGVDNKAKTNEKQAFVELGKAVIEYWVKN